MALPERETAAGNSFGLEIDGVRIGGISEVSGPALDQDVIELKQNTADGKYVTRKAPGRPKAGEVTLVRPLSEDGGFDSLAVGTTFEPARKGGAIIVYDAQGNPIRRYRIVGGAVAGREVDALTEKLVITYERLEAE